MVSSQFKKTPRQAVGAHYGIRDWLMQRVTAVVIALYVLGLLGVLLTNPALTVAQWQNLFTYSWVKLATFVALISVFLHAWVGMRDIIMDYIQPTGIRLGLQVVVIVALVCYTGWGIEILWGFK